MPNRLAAESSPYLLQHAHNPVDWYPWGDEAFARARADDRPVLLSVGYAACHWCHVMERESFEDEETARLMNALYVNVKVDREERPDVDAVYMTALQAMTGHGGWPMTVFLTPEGEPFVAGTYFPPDDRHGIPSFRRVLESVSDAWRTRRHDVARTTASLRAMYAQAERGLAGGTTGAPAAGLTPRTLERAARAVVSRVDAERGGLAGAPKFPATMAMEFLLTQWARTGGPNGGDPELLEIPLATFRAMARGGIYDQIGGGFARYSVDAEWTVPHFEKMLYDNALLVRHGVHLWQATGGPNGGDPEVRRVVEETLDWLAREMTVPAGTALEGAFYSTLDADSEGHEGRFYVWTPTELETALADAGLGAVAPALREYWEVTPAGNFEGKSILLVDRDRPWAAEEGPDAALADAVRRAKPALLAAREHRVRPGRDEKILAGWNGLMLRAVADAARVFGRPADRAAAERAGDFLARTFVDAGSGRVQRVHKDGRTKIPGFLDDHAALALGFLALHALTLAPRWLALARAVTSATVDAFWDDERGTFFDTARDAERLVTRPREPTDNAIPSGTSLAVELLLHMAELDDAAAWRTIADRVLVDFAEPMARHAVAFGQLLQAADLAVHGATTVVLAGEPGAPALRALADAAAQPFVPALVVTGGTTAEFAGIGASPAAVAAGRDAGAHAVAAYICRHSTCGLPAHTPEAVTAQLLG
ncbi:thioredoxin domain-containing protein [Gemmatimonadetes bacterium T265]|nr:thioredoxin domain-containing protein [Gemmatimonadetes bacterium T265]